MKRLDLPSFSSLSKGIRPLGIVAAGQQLILYFDSKTSDGVSFLKGYLSSDGQNYSFIEKPMTILLEKGAREQLSRCTNFRFSQIDQLMVSTYVRTIRRKAQLCIAESSNLLDWRVIHTVGDIQGAGMVVPNFQFEGQYVLYFGEDAFHVAYSKDFKKWHIADHSVIDGTGNLDAGILGIMVIDEGILVLTYRRTAMEDSFIYSLDAALFDKSNPERLLWRLPSFWTEPIDWIADAAEPIGIVYVDGEVRSIWNLGVRGVFSVSHSLFSNTSHDESHISFLILHKYEKNPILTPVDTHFWESKAVFNPTALYDNGKTHIIYRAVGEQYVSVLGYASSTDGFRIDERLEEPVYVPREPFEMPFGESSYISSTFISGMGWGGCEDPRLTRIGNRIFMTYVAHNGWSEPRVALTSIAREDFLAKRWNWEKPVLISRPGVVDKNAAILPETVDGKYVIFHRVFPNILIDFVDTLDFDGNTFLKGEYTISPRKHGWDSRKVGTGPSPIKTDRGWLLIYHAVNDKADGEYKMGAMLLDLKDPRKVLLRSTKPILEPKEWYENVGHKTGVPYPCGATLVDGTLFVYYGGADSVVCVATADIDDFLDRLEAMQSPRLYPMPM